MTACCHAAGADQPELTFWQRNRCFFSQPGTQAWWKWAGKYWYSNKKSFVYLLVCIYMLRAVSVQRLPVSVCVCKRVHCDCWPAISLLAGMRIFSSNWQVLNQISQVVSCLLNISYIRKYHCTPHRNISLLIDWIASCSLPLRFPVQFSVTAVGIWYWSYHGNCLHLRSVISFFFLF